jgi:hypothetical protein
MELHSLFIVPQGLGTECMSERSSLQPMILRISSEHNIGASDRGINSVEGVALQERRSIFGDMIINVPECDRRPKAEFVGGSSDNIAVLSVQVTDIMNVVPTGPTAYEPKLFKVLAVKGRGVDEGLYLTACCYLGSRELGERMEVQPVDYNANDPRRKL